MVLVREEIRTCRNPHLADQATTFSNDVFEIVVIAFMFGIFYSFDHVVETAWLFTLVTVSIVFQSFFSKNFQTKQLTLLSLAVFLRS